MEPINIYVEIYGGTREASCCGENVWPGLIASVVR